MPESNADWRDCGLCLGEYRLTVLPSGDENSYAEFRSQYHGSTRGTASRKSEETKAKEAEAMYKAKEAKILADESIWTILNNTVFGLSN